MQAIAETKMTPDRGHNAYGLEEHLENSSPLIIEEIARWSDILWEDYLDYNQEKKLLKKLKVPRV